jgi:hypothetical protein
MAIPHTNADTKSRRANSITTCRHTLSRMRNEPRQRHDTAVRLAYHATRQYCSGYGIWVPTRRVVLYAANDVSEEHAASVFGLQDVCYTGRLS